MSNVIAFPGARRAPKQETEPAAVPAPEPSNVRLESHTVVQPVIAPQTEGQKPYVALRLDTVERMVEALSFYAKCGWDDGKKAQAALVGAV